MTKEELEKEAEDYTEQCYGWTNNDLALDVAKATYIASAEPREKRIAELEEKISILLSCKKCPENKGGFICAKEYENRCLSQKIQFIKELQEENAELRKDKKELCHSISEGGKACVYLNEQLTKATKIIKKLYAVYYAPCVTESDLKYRDELFAEIKQFLSEVEK